MQIGVPLDVFLVHVPTETRFPLVFVNPQIIRCSEETAELSERCLSFGKVRQVVRRSARVTVHRLTESGARDVQEFGGLTARAILHELEHPRRVRRNIRVESASGDADKGGTQLQVEVRSP